MTGESAEVFAYFDKSSDHPIGVTSVAGYLGTMSQWQSVRNDWAREIKYWSMNEGFRRLSGFHMAKLCDEMGKDKSQDCINSFKKIILDSELQAIGAAICEKDWHRASWGHDVTARLDSPYQQCLSFAFEILGNQTKSRFPSNEVKIICCADAKPEIIDSVFQRAQMRFPLFKFLKIVRGNQEPLLQCADLGAGLLRQSWSAILDWRNRGLPWGELPSGAGTSPATSFWSLQQATLLRRLLTVVPEQR